MKINHIMFITEAKRTRRVVALLFGLAMMICVLLLGLQAAKPAHAAGTTFTVNSTGDAVDANPGSGTCQTSTAGECTLRAALQEANMHSGADTIAFDIPSSSDPHCDAFTQVCTISPSSNLPQITRPVTIDSYTQPGATRNTLTQPDKTDAVLKIELAGTHSNLLFVTFRNTGSQASNSVVRGLRSAAAPAVAAIAASSPSEERVTRSRATS